jgi:hypothetical protein
MKLLRLGLVGVMMCVLFQGASTHAVDVAPHDPLPVLAESPVIVTGYSLSHTQLHYVQLFNVSDKPVNLRGWHMEYLIAEQTAPILSIELSGWIAPSNYLVAADSSVVGNADFSYALTVSGTAEELRLVPPQTSEFAPYGMTLDQAGTFQRKKSATTGNYLSTFEAITNPTLYGGGFYELPDVTLLQFSEILANPRDCSPLETALDCGDYVKVYNPTDQIIDLSHFRLRIGYRGQNPSTSNTYLLAGGMQPGHYAVVTRSADDRPLSITNSGGFIWIEDAYGVRRYDNTVQSYADASADSRKGQAWAYDARDGAWKWTSQPTPLNSPSVFPVETPQAKAAATNTLLPCREGQYRSEETNRCRSIEGAIAAALTPCKEGQERNPETNRCRLVATLANQLTPCKEGQERNPETNRCRNVTTSIPEAAFAVEPMAEGAKAFAGWWALGGIGLLAVGYGVWEWRQELLGGIRKLGSFFTSSK